MSTIIADVSVTTETLHEIADDLETVGYAELVDHEGRVIRLFHVEEN